MSHMHNTQGEKGFKAIMAYIDKHVLLQSTQLLFFAILTNQSLNNTCVLYHFEWHIQARGNIRTRYQSWGLSYPSQTVVIRGLGELRNIIRTVLGSGSLNRIQAQSFERKKNPDRDLDSSEIPGSWSEYYTIIQNFIIINSP